MYVCTYKIISRSLIPLLLFVFFPVLRSCLSCTQAGKTKALAVLSQVAVCCSVMQCVAVCCSVLQCAAVWCSVQDIACAVAGCNVLYCVAICCSVLQYAAVCFSVLHCVALICSWKVTFCQICRWKGLGKHDLLPICQYQWFIQMMCVPVIYGSCPWCKQDTSHITGSTRLTRGVFIHEWFVPVTWKESCHTFNMHKMRHVTRIRCYTSHHTVSTRLTRGAFIREHAKRNHRFWHLVALSRRFGYVTMQHIVTHTATHGNTLQHTARGDSLRGDLDTRQ